MKHSTDKKKKSGSREETVEREKKKNIREEKSRRRRQGKGENIGNKPQFISFIHRLLPSYNTKWSNNNKRLMLDHKDLNRIAHIFSVNLMKNQLVMNQEPWLKREMTKWILIWVNIEHILCQFYWRIQRFNF